MGKFGSVLKKPFDRARDVYDHVEGNIRNGRDRLSDAHNTAKETLGGLGRGLTKGASALPRPLKAPEHLQDSKIIGISNETYKKFVDAYKQNKKMTKRGLQTLVSDRHRDLPQLVRKGLKLYDQLIRQHGNKREALNDALEFVAGKPPRPERDPVDKKVG